MPEYADNGVRAAVANREAPMISRWMRVWIALAMMALGGAPAAHAQLVNPLGKDAIGLSADESARIKAAVREVLAQYTTGARADWQSADGKRAGTVVITKVYTAHGRRCATVQHSFTKGEGYPMHAPLCEVAKDEWLMAF
jgi:hypothetical protein